MDRQSAPWQGPAVSRRALLLGTAGLGLGALTGCGGGAQGVSRPALLTPGSAAGTLQAAPLSLDLAGSVAATWGYNGTVPGPEIRLRRGETLRVRLANALPDPSTVHWHGIALPNAMDGVPDLTQAAVPAAGEFDYEFVVPEAGSFMYHSHVGHQIDRGLYGPLIVEDPDEPLGYDREYTLMFDDWSDGLVDPAAHAADEHDEEDEEPVAGVNDGPKMGGRRYPHFLVNGRPAADPAAFEVRRGERVRLRLMNIAADTGFLVAIGGHRMRITHTDGMPVEEVVVDAVRLGMGERYDAIVEADTAGAWPIVAIAEAKRGLARAVLRYSDATAAPTPPADARPAELTGRLLSYDDLRPLGDPGPTGDPTRVHELTLTTEEINDQRWPDADPLPVAAGEIVRVTMRNTSVQWHPMHLHGHHFRVRTAAGAGPRKDTVLVPGRGGEVSFDVACQNPGKWLFHCHNHFHMDKGMARVLEYR